MDSHKNMRKKTSIFERDARIRASRLTSGFAQFCMNPASEKTMPPCEKPVKNNGFQLDVLKVKLRKHIKTHRKYYKKHGFQQLPLKFNPGVY